MPKVVASITKNAKGKTHVKALVTANVKQAVQVAPSAPQTVVLIDLTQESDSEDCGADSSGTRPRAMPSLPRRKVLVSKQPVASGRARARLPPTLPSSVASSALTVARARPDGHESTSSESEDEALLETMLAVDASDSDMDCPSSDVESPFRLLGYLPLDPICGGDGRSDALPRWRSYHKDPFW